MISVSASSEKDDVLLAQASIFALLLDEILLGDLELFDFGVSVQAQHLHAVLQRAGDGVEHVCRCDEKHLREIVFDVEIMVLETCVLLGVENFEQRRGRVAAEIAGHLIHFIEHEDGIFCSSLLHRLDDLSGQGSDVGAPVARISASSRTPPSDRRTNFRPVALAMDMPSEVLPTPGGPTKQRMEPLGF